MSKIIMANIYLLNVSYEYGTDTDIFFNLIKAVWSVFKPNAYKLCLPTVFEWTRSFKI